MIKNNISKHIHEAWEDFTKDIFYAEVIEQLKFKILRFCFVDGHLKFLEDET